MNFGEAMIAGLRHAFCVKGRASRYEYWCFFAFVLVLVAIFGAQMRFFTSLLARSAPDIVNLGVEFHLRQITQPLPTIPGTLGLLALLAASVLFLLGTGLTLLVLIIPLLTLQARRLHDTGRSGWWAFNANLALMAAAGILALAVQADKPYITIAAALVALGFLAVPMTLLFLLAQPGELDRNQYDAERPEPARRTAPPPLYTGPLPPSVGAPAE